MRLRTNDVLVASKLEPEDRVTVKFFRIVRCTTNTCELQELRKEIVKQIGTVQEVAPRVSEVSDASEPLRRKVGSDGVQIDEHTKARLWDGETRWQTAIIHIPE
jgi:hypothetical protein